MRHAVTNFGRGTATPAERALLRLGIQPDKAVIVPGLLPLPFAVAGTRLIAFVPGRLAERCAGPARPGDRPRGLGAAGTGRGGALAPGRSGDPTLRWLRGILRELSSAPGFMSGAPAG